jgi:60kDa lysophospholipase
LAAKGPNLEVLRDFLSHGASVHLRNKEGHTPLFLAAAAGLKDHVILLREAGAHLHPDEVQAMADSSEKLESECWKLATQQGG